MKKRVPMPYIGKLQRISRRLSAVTVVAVAALALAACSSSSPSSTATTAATDAATTDTEAATTPAGNDSTTNAAEQASSGTFNSGHGDYDAIVNAGPVAPAEVVAGSTWATAIKNSGKLRVGGTDTSKLFSLLDPATNIRVGFDAGLAQLLSRYILGDVSTEYTTVTTPTREQVITSNTVDVVFATYSITPARMEQVDFAGPYYQSKANILVLATNTNINSVADLAGKKVATQQGSTGVALLQKEAPQATIQELPDNAQALAAVQQGQVDAYVQDQTILLNGLLANPDQLKLVGEPFGDPDLYGVGVAKDSDGKDFINEFIKTVVNDGTWEKLWKATIGAQTGVTTIPPAPAIGSAGN